MSSPTPAPRKRLQLITDLERKEHSFLTEADTCIFHGEYSAGKGFGFSATNQLIHNFKKKMDRRGRPEWNYKAAAIAQAADVVSSGITEEYLRNATLVPMPPSKGKSDPMYDDRMLQMLRRVATTVTGDFDIRELLECPVSQVASHESNVRPTIDEIEAGMAFNVEAAASAPIRPGGIWLFDDVLTTGAHFKAACRHIRRNLGGEVFITGFFIARRALDDGSVFDDF